MKPEDFWRYLEYIPETGQFFWNERENDPSGFNLKLAHSEAFSSIDDQGYRQTEIKGKKYRAGRLAWFMIHGEWPDNIDHINGDKTDDRISNLRNVSHKENGLNQKRSSRNKSGVVGVRLVNNKWEAGISVDGKRVWLGAYFKMEDAIKARKEAEIKYGYHKNHGR